MTIILRKIKSLNPKKTLAVIVAAGLVAVAISSPLVRAVGPEFNVFDVCYNYENPTQNCDFPLLDAKNISQGTDWARQSRTITANPGDEIGFQIYYHNGMPDSDQTTAHGAFARAGVNPAGVSASSHVVGASVGAQNASTVWSASHGGDITVNIAGGQSLALTYVPGSTVLYPDQGTSPRPGGISRPDTIFDSGVGIGTGGSGEVRGCWDFIGFVNFRMKVGSVTPPSGDLRITKDVKNVTDGTAFNETQVSADPGETVEYRITVSAVNNTVNNVTLRDVIDGRLTPSGNADLFSGSGRPLGSVSPGNPSVVIFQATVAGSGRFSAGTVTLPNNATASSGSLSVSDGANVVVTVNAPQLSCVFTYDAPHVADGSLRGLRRSDSSDLVYGRANVREVVTGLQPNSTFRISNVGPQTFRSDVLSANSSGGYDFMDRTVISGRPAGDYQAFIEVAGSNVIECRGFRIEQPVSRELRVQKDVRNEKTGASSADSVDAQPGHRVSFTITITPGSSNTPVDNVMLADVLQGMPGKLNFVPNSLNVNGVQQNGSTLPSQISIGTISPGGSVPVRFQVDVTSTSNFTAGNTEVFVNTATATASGLTASDTASVRVFKPADQKQPGSPASRPTS